MYERVIPLRLSDCRFRGHVYVVPFGANCPRLFPRRFPCVVEGYPGDVRVYNCQKCPSSVDRKSGLVFFPLECGRSTCLFSSLVGFRGGECKGRCLGGVSSCPLIKSDVWGCTVMPVMSMQKRFVGSRSCLVRALSCSVLEWLWPLRLADGFWIHWLPI